MDEEEELENMLIGRNQRRRNRRPEEIQAQNLQGATSAISDFAKGDFAKGVLGDVVEATPEIAAAKFVQESPIIKGMKGKVPTLLRRFVMPAFSMSGAGGRGILPIAAFGTGYGVTRGVDNVSKNLPGMGGEKFTDKLARFVAPEVFENEEAVMKSLNNQARYMQETQAMKGMSEDDKLDNLQNALKSVPNTPQVVPERTPEGAQAAGQRLIDAAKEFYPGAFATEAPAAPAAPALADPARTGLTTEQMQGLSPDALQAIRTPSIPESVTSAEVPAGLGPMRPVDPRTGEFLPPEVIAAGEGAGLTFPSQVALPEAQAPAAPAAPAAPVAPMSVEETKARLQSRFGAPTISQIQALPQGQGRGTAVDAQGRMIPRTEQPKETGGSAKPEESQTQKDTAAADSKVIKSKSAQGRRYTDSDLRRAFPDPEEYQAARVKDMNGINPFSDESYADEEIDRQNVIADTAARGRTNVDEPEQTQAEIIQEAIDFATELATATGFIPGTKEFKERVNEIMSSKLGVEVAVPRRRMSDAEANALYKLDPPGIQPGDRYINEKDEEVVFVAPKKEEEEKKSFFERLQAVNPRVGAAKFVQEKGRDKGIAAAEFIKDLIN